MLDYRNITKSPLKHTYPYGTTDTVVDLGTTAEIKETVAEVFKQQPECRRVIVPVPVGDTDGVIAAEEAGLRYVLDVTQRLSLIHISEPTRLSLVSRMPSSA